MQELENHLQKNGIAVPPASVSLPPVPLLSVSNDGRSIKQEPYDEIPPSPSHTPSNCIVRSLSFIFLIAEIHFPTSESELTLFNSCETEVGYCIKKFQIRRMVPINCIIPLIFPLLFQNSGFLSQLTDTTAAMAINSPISGLNNHQDGGSFLKFVFPTFRFLFVVSFSNKILRFK